MEEYRWKSIINESKEKQSNIGLAVENLKNRYFFIDFDDVEKRVKFFERIDIAPHFKYNINLSRAASYKPNADRTSL